MNRIRNYIYISLFLLGGLLVLPGVIKAQEYVLPYPSTMPGSHFYNIKLVLEKIQEFWSFGSLNKFSYYLRMSDKYLVEAKVLFEYRQYLLASKALKKSNDYISLVPFFLDKAQNEGKNINRKQELFNQARLKHILVLQSLIQSLPSEFTWLAEKSEPIDIPIHDLLKNSIRIRNPE